MPVVLALTATLYILVEIQTFTLVFKTPLIQIQLTTPASSPVTTDHAFPGTCVAFSLFLEYAKLITAPGALYLSFPSHHLRLSSNDAALEESHRATLSKVTAYSRIVKKKISAFFLFSSQHLSLRGIASLICLLTSSLPLPLHHNVTSMRSETVSVFCTIISLAPRPVSVSSHTR